MYIFSVFCVEFVFELSFRFNEFSMNFDRIVINSNEMRNESPSPSLCTSIYEIFPFRFRTLSFVGGVNRCACEFILFVCRLSKYLIISSILFAFENRRVSSLSALLMIASHMNGHGESFKLSSLSMRQNAFLFVFHIENFQFSLFLFRSWLASFVSFISSIRFNRLQQQTTWKENKNKLSIFRVIFFRFFLFSICYCSSSPQRTKTNRIVSDVPKKRERKEN